MNATSTPHSLERVYSMDTMSTPHILELALPRKTLRFGHLGGRDACIDRQAGERAPASQVQPDQYPSLASASFHTTLKRMACSALVISLVPRPLRNNPPRPSRSRTCCAAST
eukprot:6191389-Pleurochrysis_carterae.AAC.2